MIDFSIKIPFPFHKISYEAMLTSLVKMNSLESIIMTIILFKSKEKEYQRQTLKKTIENILGIQGKTMSIINAILDDLIKSKSFGEKIKSVNDLLEKEIRLIERAIPKELKKKIEKRKFYKISKEKTYKDDVFYEPLVDSTSIPNEIQESTFDKNIWQVHPLETNQIEISIELEANKLCNSESQLVEKTTLLEKDTKVVCLDLIVKFKKDDNNRLIPNNKIADVLCEKILNDEAKISILEKALTNYDIILKDGKGGKRIETLDKKHVIINDIAYIYKNSKFYEAFNQNTTYSISHKSSNVSFNIHELSEKELKKQVFYALLLKNLDFVSQIEMFGKNYKELAKDFMMFVKEKGKIKLLPKNVKEFYLKMNHFVWNLQNQLDFVLDIYTEGEIQNRIKGLSKNDINNNINLWISLADNKKINIDYDFFYGLMKPIYDENTILFPKWKSEIEFKKLIKKIKSYNLEDESQKLDIDKVKESLNKFDIFPIITNVKEKFLNELKEWKSKLPISEKDTIIYMGQETRKLCEKIVDQLLKKEKVAITKNLKYHEKVGAIKELGKDYKKILKNVYKDTNKFHHADNYKIDANLEKKLKENILDLKKIKDSKKMEIEGYIKVLKWATQLR